MNKLKITIRLFAITIAILLLTQIPAYATTGTSTGSGVRVRESASTDSKQIEVLAANDRVEILATEGDWYKISYKDIVGYVNKSFIDTGDNKVEDSKKTEENSTETPKETVEEAKKENNTTSEDDNQKSSEPAENNNEEANETAPVENEQETNVSQIYRTEENVQVNILPVITSEQIGEIKKDKSVTLITTTGLWAYVKTDSIDGWIMVDKLSTQTEEQKQPQNDDVTNNEQSNEEINNESANTNSLIGKTIYTKASSVNVRSEANTSSEIVASVAINTEVKVVDEQDGWYKVEFDGKTGYIREDLLSEQKTEVTSRTNSIDRTAAVIANNTAEEISVKVEENSTAAAAENNSTQKSAATTSSTNSGSVTGTDIANYAKQFVGCKYVYGAAGPSSFDCSGLTMYVYKHFGYSLSHSSKVQATQGKAVTGELQPGDILVFSNNGTTVGHVGIYIGNDQFVHASDSSTGVIISNLSAKCNKSKYWGARRII